ncbi:MAG TPA: thioredoxin domain-containing protein [Candidatus Eisenbacteria bacterium]|nr:thioredoxin domain-containing protein [Candidatus Eisenbacteria bacterium]
MPDEPIAPAEREPTRAPTDPPAEALEAPATAREPRDAATAAHRHTNRLINETSPYLLQHAHNPVDWSPWGPDALARAKLLDRPIFLSIGYAACHWCHVMERESFEDEATAAVLNQGFVPIKVDREERPDLDQIYMAAVQAMTGGGGWPMSVFLTPEGRPFYGGTYFPDKPRHGLPSFQELLAGIDRAWREQRAELEQAGLRLVNNLAEQARLPVAQGQPGPELLDTAILGIERSFDPSTGGWGGAPKFPQPMTIEFLLRRAAVTGDARSLAMARRTLDAMADGGIHDQLGSGFHRYATDARWLVPHFEQMLYDNAQLARVYIHAWAATGDARYRAVATGVLDYILRELTTSDGAFAASQDADTEGVEGATFTWRAAEIERVLGDDAAVFSAAYGVTDGGNWEGVTILSRVRSAEELGQAFGAPAAEIEAGLARARQRLLAQRAGRVQPARDDKALAAWNGLAIAALADAARVLGFAADAARDDAADAARDDAAVDAVHGSDARDDAAATDLAEAAGRYRQAAERAAGAVLDGLLEGDRGSDTPARLGRSWKDGRATGQGVLEDYANLAEGLLALYEATFEERWFVVARSLIDAVLDRFADPDGGFFDTATDHERLVTRPKDVQDNATPSGAAMATFALLKLAALTGEGRYRTAAERAVAAITPSAGRYPTAFAMWLQTIDLALSDIAEVAVVGDLGDPATRALLRVAAGGYAPGRVIAASAAGAATVVPLLQDRPLLKGRPTAYVCRGFACQAPVTDPDALQEQLAERAAAL